MLPDHVAIVTGAGQGIGRAIAVELAKSGAHVVACGRRLEPLEAVAGEARALGRRSLALSCDVREAAQVDQVVAETETEAMIAQAAREVPLQRLGRPEEIAWAVIFLASERANFITGETLYVSGGPRVSNRED
jgi:NAD(P)-dependent dehydrogenase (short-subunit alcohol dehydrogenase family)